MHTHLGPGQVGVAAAAWEAVVPNAQNDIVRVHDHRAHLFKRRDFQHLVQLSIMSCKQKRWGFRGIHYGVLRGRR